MVKPQPDLYATQRIARIDIQHQWKEPGREFTETWGELEITSPALVYARDIHLKSIENMVLTVDSGVTSSLYATKQVFNKGRKNNYASIFIWDGATPSQASGSHYVNFLAMGE